MICLSAVDSIWIPSCCSDGCIPAWFWLTSMFLTLADCESTPDFALGFHAFKSGLGNVEWWNPQVRRFHTRSLLTALSQLHGNAASYFKSSRNVWLILPYTSKLVRPSRTAVKRTRQFGAAEHTSRPEQGWDWGESMRRANPSSRVSSFPADQPLLALLSDPLCQCRGFICLSSAKENPRAHAKKVCIGAWFCRGAQFGCWPL